MLTEQEREWLEQRKNSVYINEWGYPCSNPLSYDRLADFIDSAKFEALVAVKLAQNEYMFIPCYLSGTKLDDCPHKDWDYNQCRIKYARLAVEQEMDDADRKRKGMAGEAEEERKGLRQRFLPILRAIQPGMGFVSGIL